MAGDFYVWYYYTWVWRNIYFLKGTEDWLSSGFVLESLWWLGLLTGTITSVGLAIIQLWQSKDIVHIESKTKAIKEKE